MGVKSNGRMPRDVIKAKRLEKKVTLAQLAKTVGKNPTFVAAALQGNHRLTEEEATLFKFGRDRAYLRAE